MCSARAARSTTEGTARPAPAGRAVRLLGLGAHAVVVGAVTHEQVASFFLAVLRTDNDNGAARFHVLRIGLRIIIRQTQSDEWSRKRPERRAESGTAKRTGKQSAGKDRPHDGDHAGGDAASHSTDAAANRGAGDGAVAGPV